MKKSNPIIHQDRDGHYFNVQFKHYIKKNNEEKQSKSCYETFKVKEGDFNSSWIMRYEEYERDFIRHEGLDEKKCFRNRTYNRMLLRLARRLSGATNSVFWYHVYEFQRDWESYYQSGLYRRVGYQSFLEAREIISDEVRHDLLEEFLDRENVDNDWMVDGP